jgi:integrase
VERAWDYHAHRFVPPKSRAGVRTVPIIERLALLLADHRVLTNQADGLLFPGSAPDEPTYPSAFYRRMSAAWEAADLVPIGFHEARHTAASLFIAAGLNAKTVSTYLGHASVAITFDRYGHLFPGAEHEARGLLDAYLERHEG